MFSGIETTGQLHAYKNLISNNARIHVLFSVLFIQVSISKRRKLRINFVWLIPCHYGFWGTFPELLYLLHAKAMCVSHRGPSVCCAKAADVLDLPAVGTASTAHIAVC